MVASINERKEFLSISINNIFMTINELLVKIKSYLYQNKAHRKETLGLLVNLGECRHKLYGVIGNSFFIEGYEKFSNEIKQWNLNAVLTDDDFNADFDALN
jgi:hypothetical protein